MTSNKGTYVWFDLVTADTEAAAAFYGETIGWKTLIRDMGGQDYTMWLTPGGDPVGGFMAPWAGAKAAGAPPHWLRYVSVADVAATAKQAVELGGRVRVPPTTISPTSSFTVLEDPQGAGFAAYSSTDAVDAAWTPPSGVGTFAWSELSTTDWVAARAFYGALFGWQETASLDMGVAPGEDDTYWMYGADPKTSLGGMSNMAKLEGCGSHWLHYASVADLDATLTRITANGGKVISGPMEVPGGDRVARCVDPQGAAFAVHQRHTA